MKHVLQVVVACVALALCLAIPAGVGAADDGHPVVLASGQTLMPGNIAHVWWDLKVGPDPFDAIRVHRVVKAQRPEQPRKLPQAVMLLPGSPTYFTSLYIEPTISAISPQRSIAVYLAKHDIDVWGIDYGWALVPVETTDFSFMQDWGVDRDAAHVQAALSFARSTRGTGEAFILAGLSYGGAMTYAVAADDSQRPADQRNVKGIIPMDYGLKYDDPAVRALSCEMLAADAQRLSDGVYAADDGIWLAMFGELALSAPDDPSPFDPLFTNLQFALLTVTSPLPPVNWHFVGGYFDENGLPYDLRFTETRLLLDLLKSNEPPYYPWRTNYDVDAAACDGSVDVPFDDHLGDIRVPIFYIGAAGGFGRSGIFTTTLTESPDVSTLIVQQLPDGQRMMDFGHADLLTAKHAQPLVWKPVLDWIKAHR